MKIQDARSLPAVAQEDLRRKAVKAVLDGRKQIEVAKLFCVSRVTLIIHKLVPSKGGDVWSSPSIVARVTML